MGSTRPGLLVGFRCFSMLWRFRSALNPILLHSWTRFTMALCHWSGANLPDLRCECGLYMSERERAWINSNPQIHCSVHPYPRVQMCLCVLAHSHGWIKMWQHVSNAWFHVCPSVPILWMFSTLGYFTRLLRQWQLVFKTMKNFRFFITAL